MKRKGDKNKQTFTDECTPMHTQLWRPEDVPCRCTATLQKACRITESQSGITRCVELCQMRQWHRCYC